MRVASRAVEELEQPGFGASVQEIASGLVNSQHRGMEYGFSASRNCPSAKFNCTP